MAEVQCWDGDGTVPPEVKALIEENASLKAENQKLRKEQQFFEKGYQNTVDELNELKSRMWQIRAIAGLVNQKQTEDHIDQEVSESEAHEFLVKMVKGRTPYDDQILIEGEPDSN